MSLRWRIGSAVALLAGLAAFGLLAGRVRAEKPSPRVIVLGFDGADAKYVEKWMAEGKLPNLERLRKLGGYRRLRPTVPAQTPVSWSSFSTGLNPAGTAIFDFLKRDPKNYMPTFAVADEGEAPFYFGERNPMVFGAAAGVGVFLVVVLGVGFATGGFGVAAAIAALLGAGAGYGVHHYVRKNVPVKRPTVTNNRQGVAFWEAVANAGKKARVVQVPVTFPPRPFPKGEMLSGLGVPDIRGRIGTPSFYTSEISFTMKNSNEFSVEVVELPDNRGDIETEVFGPPDKIFGDGKKWIKEKMTLSVPESRDSLRIRVSGTDLTLKPGEWSDWVPFTFRFNDLIKVQAVGRFHLYEIKPEVKLYLSPLHFHPGALPFGLAITHPEGWSGDLYKKFGFFKTMGWSCDTWSISEELMDEKTFLEDVDMTVSKFREMFREFLKSEDTDLFVHCFEFTDRIGHIFWRLMDEKHPAFDSKLQEKFGEALLDSYRQMDAIVGDALPLAESGKAILIVCSDHGFSTWTRSINTNTWLVKNGYLALKGAGTGEVENLEKLFSKDVFWVNVDWSKTRAYALGLGGLYVNLAGREAQGIVQPGEEYRTLVAELRQKLEAWEDPETGKKPVLHVYTRDEAYGKYDPNLIPDMFVANSEGYRASWQTSLGGMPPDLIEVNKQVWSGDHCSLDPSVVPGILFASRPIPVEQPTITDLAPTVLELMGVPLPGPLDGKSVFREEKPAKPTH
jgi:predicted AlkP superfamily phosphohydrolase/phosphomutase